MILTGGIQRSFGRFLIKRKHKKRNRNRSIKNYKDIRSVGIIGAFESKEHVQEILKLQEQLKQDGKQVNVCLFVSSKSVLKNEELKKRIQLFGNADLNFFYLAKSALLKAFVSQKFDVLINVSLKPCFQVFTQVGLSNAAFKVGRSFEEMHFADISIELAQEVEFDAYIKQVLHYISELNKG